MTETLFHARFQTHPDAVRIDSQGIRCDAELSRKLLAILNSDALFIFIVRDNDFTTLVRKIPQTTIETHASFCLFRILVDCCRETVRLLDVQMPANWIPERLSFHQFGHALN